jgi:hypothetical protein
MVRDCGFPRFMRVRMGVQGSSGVSAERSIAAMCVSSMVMRIMMGLMMGRSMVRGMAVCTSGASAIRCMAARCVGSTSAYMLAG